MPASSDVGAFRAALSSAKSIIILSGAGISVASGIPSFRGTTSGADTWSKNGAMTYSSAQTFGENPSAVWQFYHHRRLTCLHAKPNDAHKALACLTIESIRERVAPMATSNPLHITQNIDSMALRVLETLPVPVKELSEKSVVEMHGSLFVTRCTSCRHTRRVYAPTLAASLDGLKEDTQDVDRINIPTDKLPRCGGDSWSGANRYGNCGGLLRPEIVWFGEIPPLMGEISRKLNWCDLLLVVGTSSLVHPAAGFATHVQNRGGKVALFNVERSKNDEAADFLFMGKCEDVLPDILDVRGDIAAYWPM